RPGDLARVEVQVHLVIAEKMSVHMDCVEQNREQYGVMLRLTDDSIERRQHAPLPINRILVGELPHEPEKPLPVLRTDAQKIHISQRTATLPKLWNIYERGHVYHVISVLRLS